MIEALLFDRQVLVAALLTLLAAPAAQAAVTETRSTAYVYDSRGQVIREFAKPQDSTLCLVNVYSYDGNRISTQPRNCDGARPRSPA